MGLFLYILIHYILSSFLQSFSHLTVFFRYCYMMEVLRSSWKLTLFCTFPSDLLTRCRIGEWCSDLSYRIFGLLSSLKHRRPQRMKKMKRWRRKMRMKRKEGRRARKSLLNHLRCVTLVLMDAICLEKKKKCK